MPYNKPNPTRLAKEASHLLELQSQVQKFVSKLAKSKTFAVRFDEAVRNEDTKLIKQLAKEGGITKQIEIEELDSDMMIRIKACGFGVCVTITIRW